jgi:hypothetical protein
LKLEGTHDHIKHRHRPRPETAAQASRRTRGRRAAATVAMTLALTGVANASSEGSFIYENDSSYCNNNNPNCDIIWNMNSLDLGGRQLIMQNDGNLVMYNLSVNPRQVCWASNTYGQGGGSTYAIFQADGNFVVYPSVGAPAIWASSWDGWWAAPNSGETVDLEYNGDGRVNFYVGYHLVRTC